MRLLARWTAAGLLLALAPGCTSREERAAQKTGGDPRRGQALILRLGCGACHTIPGVEGATGLVGPSLDRIGSRDRLAGRLPNTPENLLRWIRDPQGIAPGTAMPDLGLTEQEGRDVAAYLYSLE